MRQSELFTKTSKKSPKEAEALNHKLLVQAGFIDRLSSGVFTLLPLGLRVVKKIENIVREEMNNLGAQEILMPALIPRENWEQTDRWNLEVVLKTKSRFKKEYGLGWTQEEVITPLVKKFVSSYRDLPKAIYQIQTKFRDEPRPKSGLFRTREFSMKDLYSFHENADDLDKYYEKVKESYFRIYQKLGIGKITLLTFASGGDFTKYSHEFQMLTSFGEDDLYICDKCEVALNAEIAGPKPTCLDCKSTKLRKERGIEVGNIFKLNDKFSKPFDLTFRDSQGKEKPVLMGCYGFGITRTMGAISEVHNDKDGLKWPSSVAPFDVHLLGLEDSVKKETERVYKDLAEKFEVLWDDRGESAGEKLKDADLIGIPIRIVVSEKNIKKNKIEIKERSSTKPIFVQKNKVVFEIGKML